MLALGPWLKQRRLRLGTKLATAEGGARPLLRALRNGELVGITPDQDAGEGAGIFVPLFGRLANTMTLGPRLVQKTGALAVVSWAERLPRGTGYKLHFAAAPSGVNSDDLVESASALNVGVELPVNDTDRYDWRGYIYFIWDFADGGLFEGW